jgi:predicted transcriptional regulator
MADLNQIAKSLNIDLGSKVRGHKRRAWLTSGENELPSYALPDDEKVLQPVTTISLDKQPLSPPQDLSITQALSKDKQKINRAQTDHKRVTNGLQADYKQITNGSQTDHTTDHTLDHKRITNGLQTDHKQVTNEQKRDSVENTKLELSRIHGKEKELLFFLFNSSKKSRSHLTEALTLEHILDSTNIAKNSVKTIIHRLAKKQIITRQESKTGRGGWTIFQVHADIHNQLLMQETERDKIVNGLQTDHKQVTNRSQTDHKQITQRITQRITNPSSSSSYNINTTTDSDLTENFIAELDETAENINIELAQLQQLGVHLNNSHIQQLLLDPEITPDIIDISCDAYWFDLNFNNKKKEIKTNTINYFMGIMRKVKCYAIPDNYKSKKQRAYERLQEVITADREIERELENINFHKWIGVLSKDEKEKIISEQATDEDKQSFLMPGLTAMHEGIKNNVLRKYYKDVVMPNVPTTAV